MPATERGPPMGCRMRQSMRLRFSFCFLLRGRFPTAVVTSIPQLAVHVTPRTEWHPGFGVRTDPQNVAVRILDLHLARPREVGGRLRDRRISPDEIFIKDVDILNADPYPRDRIALIAI